MKVILNRIYKIFNIRFTMFYYFCFIFFFITSILFISINIPLIQTKISNIILHKINEKLNINISLRSLNINFISGVIELNKVKVLDYKKNKMIFFPFIKFKFNLLDFFKKKIVIKNLLINNPSFNIIIYKGHKESNLYKFIKSFTLKKEISPFVKKIIFFKTKIRNTFLSIKDLNNNKYIFFSKKINIISNEIILFNSNISFDKLNISCNGILKNKYFNIYSIYKGVYISLHKLKIINTTLFFNKSKICASILFYYNKYLDILNFYNNIKFSIKIIKNSYISSNDIRPFINLKLRKNIFLHGNVYGILKKYIVLNDFHLQNENNRIMSNKIILYNILNKKNFKIIQSKYTYIYIDYKYITNIIPNNILKKIPFFLQKSGQIKYLGELIIDNNNIISNGYININNIVFFRGKFIIKKSRNSYEGNGLITISNTYYLCNNNIDYIKSKIFFSGKNFLHKNMSLNLKGIYGILLFNNKKITNINININYYCFNNKFYGKIYTKNPELNFNIYINSYINSNIFLINSVINITYFKLNFIKSNFYIKSIFDTKILLNIRLLDIKNFYIKLFLDKINIIDKNLKKIALENINIEYNISKDVKKNFIIYAYNLFDISFNGNFQWLDLFKTLKNNINNILYNKNYINNNINNQFLDFKIILQKNFSDKFNIINSSELQFLGKINNNNITATIKDIEYKDFKLKNLYFNINYDDKNSTILSFNNIIYKNNIDIKNINIDIKKEKNYHTINTKYIGYIYNIYQNGNINFLIKNINYNNKKYIILGLNDSFLRIKNKNFIIDGNNKSIIVIDLKNKKCILQELKINSKEDSYFLSYRKVKNKYNLLELLLQRDISEKDINSILNAKYKGKLFFDKKNNLSLTEMNLKIEKILINGINIGCISLNLNTFYSKKNNINNFIIKINNNNINIISIYFKINNFSIKNNFLDIKINIQDFPVNIFKNFTEGIIDNIRGYINGVFEVHINNMNINYYGFLSLKNTGIKINYLNTEYEFIGEPIIIIKNKILILKNSLIRDIKYNTIGLLNGIVINENNKYILSLSVDSKNILVLNTKVSNNNSLYGKIFSSGKVHILYDNDNINISVTNSQLLNNSKIYITTINNKNEIEKYNFIKIIKNNNIKTSNFIDNIQDDNHQYHKIFNLNIEFNINDECDIKLIPDIEDINNYIKVRGTGDFLFKINSYDDIEMIGKYYIKDGYYNFCLNKIPIININKKFTVKKGGIIVWNGSYDNPILDITAFYPKAVSNIKNYFNSSNSLLLNSNIINLIINISGEFNHPILKFDIDIPFFNKNIKNKFLKKIDNQNEKIINFGSILFLGKFIDNKQNIENSNLYLSTYKHSLKKLGNILSNINNNVNVNFEYLEENIDTKIKMKSIKSSLEYNLNKFFAIKGILKLPVNSFYFKNENIDKEIYLNIDFSKRIDKNFKLIMFSRPSNNYEYNINNYNTFFSNKNYQIYGGKIFYNFSFEKISDMLNIF